MSVVLNQMYVENCIETLSRFDDNFIDLIVTSPPYNVDLGNNLSHKTISYDKHNDAMLYDIYLEWLKEKFSLLYLKTKKGGRCCVNIGNQKNGRIPLVKDFICLMENIGWKMYTQILWNKNQCSPRTAWGSYMSPSSPSFPTPFEFILVFCKEEYKLQHKGISDLTREEFISFSLAMWTMSPAKKSKTGHPAAFPFELPYRCIKMFSYIGDVIYDPFAGVGTTLRAADFLKRLYIGSEISINYCNLYQKNKNA
jgi:site-specific DNA-methyltransferase (adenine-specific)